MGKNPVVRNSVCEDDFALLAGFISVSGDSGDFELKFLKEILWEKMVGVIV